MTCNLRDFNFVDKMDLVSFQKLEVRQVITQLISR